MNKLIKSIEKRGLRFEWTMDGGIEQIFVYCRRKDSDHEILDITFTNEEDDADGYDVYSQADDDFVKEGADLRAVATTLRGCLKRI